MRFVSVMAGVVCLLTLTGCGQESDENLVALSWTTAEYAGLSSDGARVITILEVYGPSGATMSNLLSGQYIVKGTYDLQGTLCPGAKISLYFPPTWVTSANSPEDEGEHSIPAGSNSGSFEVTLTPVDFKGTTPSLQLAVSGDAACFQFETVTLR